MRRRTGNLIVFLLALMGVSASGWAQFQSCVFCDVNPFNPDPFPVRPCDSGSVILRGVGFSNTATNGCSATPVLMVRSTRTDRLVIIAFRLLSDGSIEVDYTVPCSATPGLVGIDVTIDDDSSDTIVPYACGNARIRVQSVCGDGRLDPGEECDDGNNRGGDGCDATCKRESTTLQVIYGSFSARRAGAEVQVRWHTLVEDQTVAFDVWRKDRAGNATRVTRLLARGAEADYRFTETSADAASYAIVEYTVDGVEGSSTGYFAVEAPGSGPSGRGGRSRRTVK